MRELTKSIDRLGAYLSKRPFVMIGALFIFLVARDWPVFLLTDVYDGFIVKTSLVSNGFSFDNFVHFIRHTALSAYDQHFIPIWFIFFFFSVWLFDTNTWLLGVLSFGFAACLLYLLFRIINFFYNDKPGGKLFSLLAILVFSGSVFFLETIAWKWQLVLLMASVFYLSSLLILLEKKSSIVWRLSYALLLLGAIWTFSVYWIGAWGLALFILLRNRTWKDNTLILTIFVALIGTLTQIIANTSSINHFNLIYIIANLPSILTLETANILMLDVGVFRFSSVAQTYASGTLAITVISLFIYKYYSVYKSKNFTERCASRFFGVSLYFVACAEFA